MQSNTLPKGKRHALHKSAKLISSSPPQAMPVAASTICLLMLSLDRYASVKHPRLGQLHQRRCLPRLLAILGWFAASLICIHFFIAYGTIATVGARSNATSAGTKQLITRQRGYTNKRYQVATTAAPSLQITCKADYGSAEIHTTIAVLHAVLVFIIPAIGVLINHLGVRQKLCALSLTARAAHGELPLPMPILRRPTHMIIVTGLANTARVNGADSSDDEGPGQMVAVANNKGPVTRLKQMPRTPR